MTARSLLIRRSLVSAGVVVSIVVGLLAIRAFYT